MPINNIATYPNLLSLRTAIFNDKHSLGIESTNLNRFPVRFVLLNNFSEMRELTRLLTESGIKLCKIEDALLFDDGWLTWGQMVDQVEQLLLMQECDSILAPFSEVIRFYNDADLKLFISNVINKQSNYYTIGRRVYLPIVGLFSQREKLFGGYDSLPKIFALEQSPSTHKRIKLWVCGIQSNFENDQFVYIKTSKQWLEHWRKDDCRDIICSSKSVIQYASNHLPDDTIFEISVISNPLDYISKILAFNVPIEFKPNESHYWEELLIDLSKSQKKQVSDFKSYVNSIFNCHKFKTSDFLKYWFSYESEYLRWLLIQLSSIEDNYKGTYLSYVIAQLTDLSDGEIVRSIATTIFDINDCPTSLIQERCEFLRYVEKHNKLLLEAVEHQVESKILDQIDSGFVVHDILSFCHGIFICEKKLITTMIASGKLSKEIAFEKYRDLYYYLSEYDYLSSISNTDWISTYFSSYRVSRVANQKQGDIDCILDKINDSEDSFFNWYTSVERSTSILSRNESVDKIYWFDGLGLEWMPLISKIVEESSGYRLVCQAIGRNELPSNTGNNRWESFRKIDELDPKYIHSNHYSHPKSLIEQIDIVSKQIKGVLASMSCETIAIVSDHGYSFLPKYEESLNYKLDKISHEGRYSPCSEFEKSDGNFVVWKSNDGKHYKIALRHKSLTTKPSHEVHGGCTPEEVLVPVFIISNKPVQVQAKVELISKEISSVSRRVYLSIQSPNEIQIASVIVRNKTIKLKFENELWYFDADITQLQSEVLFDVIIDGLKIVSLSLSVKKAVEDNDMGF